MNNREDQGVSIIVPTFREIENLPMLIERIGTLRCEFPDLELVIVDDDSQDGTAELLNVLCRVHDWLRFVNRKNIRDLASAVIEGFRKARYSTLVCMDADLSHPVEQIPAMVEAISENSQTDMVIGSRFVSGGSVDMHWPWFRRWNAWVARGLARLFTSVRDPMSGFFALKKSRFQGTDGLNPIGYKIGLELLVKCHCRHVIEIPIHFVDRYRGQSKLNIREQLRYLIHIKRLLAYKMGQRLKKP